MSEIFQEWEGLNPFVQVFYSNGEESEEVKKRLVGLNPFVQVFYSN